MKTEYEARILEINKEAFIKKLCFSESDIVTYGVSKIYQHYNIDVEVIPILKFND